jgi:type II secretory pathway pseudopilin PulG
VRRLSKTAWTILASGIFIILAAILLMSYFQQGQEQDRLSQELSSVQLLLAKQWEKFSSEGLPAKQSELESQLASVESQLNTAKANLRQPIESIESIDITDTLFEIAETSEVEIVEISNMAIIEVNPPGLIGEDLDELEFFALSFTATAEGDVANLVDFVFELNQQFPTGVIESVTIKVPAVIEEEEEITEPSVQINLSIYTYEGD